MDEIPSISSPSEAAGLSMRVAVTSRTGRLVDTHFGKADAFLIYQVNTAGNRLLERRPAEAVAENGVPRSTQRVEQIADCDAVLTMRAGSHAQELLDARGILSVEYNFTIENGLRYALREWQMQKGRQAAKKETGS